MNREKMLQNPLPIDRVAARVVRPAKMEHLWRPLPKDLPHLVPAGTAMLPTKPIPWAAIKSKPELKELPGKRRGRMVIVGYAADQGSQNKNAMWVVRCDCGNCEYRTSIFRWLGTSADDTCRECRNRSYKLRGGKFEPALDPANRMTVAKPGEQHE